VKRLEVIANRSVHDELIEALEGSLPDIEYTLLPLVHGRGKRKRKLGTRTWPETNFLLISYLDEAGAERARAVVLSIERKFPNEGVWATLSDASPI
jgi:hypothetical protein